MRPYTPQHADIKSLIFSFKMERKAMTLADARFPYARMPLHFLDVQSGVAPIRIEQFKRPTDLVLMYVG